MDHTCSYASQLHDSFRLNTGNSDSKPTIYILGFDSDGNELLARRARPTCRGVFVCVHLDPSLHNITRFELDPETYQAVIDAQADVRMQQGNDANHRALRSVFHLCLHELPFNRDCSFYQHLFHFLCTVKDKEGQRCNGSPKLIPMNKVSCHRLLLRKLSLNGLDSLGMAKHILWCAHNEVFRQMRRIVVFRFLLMLTRRSS